MSFGKMPGGFKVSEAFEFAPRKDLCEPAFRRYEKMIAKGIVEDYIVDPKELSARMNARTFVARFNDAKRGYMLYGYKSEWIPKGYNVTFVKAAVGMNEKVLVYNEFGKTKAELMKGLVVSEPVRMETPEMEAGVKWFEGVDQESLEATVVRFEDIDQFKTMLEKDEKSFLGQWVTVVCNNALEVLEVKKIQDAGKGRNMWLHSVHSKSYKEEKV